MIRSYRWKKILAQYNIPYSLWQCFKIYFVEMLAVMVVAVVGNFSSMLPQFGYSQEDIDTWVTEEPEKYLSLVMNHYADLMAHAEEKISIPLDCKENAEKARVVLSSLISKGFYLQTTTYVIPQGENEERSQQVPTSELVDDLRIMLDIVKQWDTFDLEEYLNKMGAKQ